MMETHNALIQPTYRAITVDGHILREGESRKDVVEEATRDLQHLKEPGILRRRVPGCNEYEDAAFLNA